VPGGLISAWLVRELRVGDEIEVAPPSGTFTPDLDAGGRHVMVAAGSGITPVLSIAASLGIRDQPNVPSLALGPGLVTPLDLTAAYAAFPNGGHAVSPHGILRVVDDTGDVAFEASEEQRRVLPEDVALFIASNGTTTGSAQVRFLIKLPGACLH